MAQKLKQEVPRTSNPPVITHHVNYKILPFLEISLKRFDVHGTAQGGILKSLFNPTHPYI